MIQEHKHHTLQYRESAWSTIFDWDAGEAEAWRQRFLNNITGSGTYVLPIHAPNPTIGLGRTDG